MRFVQRCRCSTRIIYRTVCYTQYIVYLKRMGKVGLGDNTQYNLLVIQIDFSPFSILLYIPMRSINIPLLLE